MRARRDSSGRFAGAAVVAVLFMGSTLLTPLYELYRAAYRLSPLTLVLLYAVYVVGNLVALLFFGRASDRLGRRPVAVAGLALALASALLFAAAKDLHWLFAARVANGFAVGVGAGAATAWMTEFTPQAERSQAASLMTAFNFLGLTIGPILAGVLVQYAPAPLRLPFFAYTAILLATAVFALRTRETLDREHAGRWSLRPRLAVPRALLLAFLPAAAAGFVAMSVVGFYAALGPTFVHEALAVSNRALSGLIVATLFAVATVVIVATRHMGARPAMTAGLALTAPGLALLVLAQSVGSLSSMMLATVACGAAAALGYRGSLAQVSELAPPERRAEVVSAYFVCCFLGNALPIIGVGAMAQAFGLDAATRTFALLLAVVAALAWAASCLARTSAARQAHSTT